MPTCCSVYGCHNKVGGHLFPSDKDKCKAWVIAIRRVEGKKGQLWWPSDSSVVCREHFKPTDYVQETFIGKYTVIHTRCIITNKLQTSYNAIKYILMNGA